MESIEERLMQDELFREHFVAKHPPKYEFKGEINPAFLGRDSSLDFAINWIKDYLSFPLLEDNFTLAENEHSLRREWRTRIIDKYGKEAGKFLNENKLRKNTLSGLWSASSIIDFTLVDLYPEMWNKTKEIIEIAEEHSDNYIRMDIQQRIELVRGLEDKAYDVLQIISKK